MSTPHDVLSFSNTAGFSPTLAWRARLAELLTVAVDTIESDVPAAKDCLERAAALVQGVTMVQTQFLEMLKRHGITRVDVQPGKAFDPNQHQAVMQKPTADVEPGLIVDVHEQGYLNQDRVLRPAKVTVSTKPPLAG